MRITNRNQMMSHLKHMNTTLTNLTKSNNKMSSQRAFDKAWENVGDATRALLIRKKIRDADFQMTNIRDVEGRLDNADSSMQTMVTMLRTVTDRTVEALNGTLTESDREKVADEISELQKEALALCNSSYADNYVFGAAGGPEKKEPFYEVNGKMTYHGFPIDDLKLNENTGKIQHLAPDPADPNTSIWQDIPYDHDNYMDIGTGFKYTKNPDEIINPDTALQYTLSGARIFGVGKNADGVSNNVYNLLGEISDALRVNDLDLLNKQFDQLPNVRDRILSGMTEVGTRLNMIEDINGILVNDKFNLQTRQNDLEAVDLAEEAINNKDCEMAWMVTLQLGSKILPSSLFDFLR